MMGADIEVLADGAGRGKRWMVMCAEHGLNRIVRTETHATNIAQLHDRIDHAEQPEQQAGASFDITAAANAYLEAHRAAYKAERAPGWSGVAAALTQAELCWHALVGCDGQRAMDLAEQYAEHQTTAHTAPF